MHPGILFQPGNELRTSPVEVLPIPDRRSNSASERDSCPSGLRGNGVPLPPIYGLSLAPGTGEELPRLRVGKSVLVERNPLPEACLLSL